jgi:ketosteroid isomerase-like protein
MQSARSRFIDTTYERVHAGDPDVFAECFTPDFTYKGPESKMMSTDGCLHGENAIRAMYSLNNGDKGSWGNVKREIATEIETDNHLFRIMRWTAKNPYKSYAGFEKLPPDMKVEIDVFILYTFRKGKICSELFAYDTLGYFIDMAQGDMKKAAAALSNFAPMMENQKASGTGGEIQFPAFPAKK